MNTDKKRIYFAAWLSIFNGGLKMSYINDGEFMHV